MKVVHQPLALTLRRFSYPARPLTMATTTATGQPPPGQQQQNSRHKSSNSQPHTNQQQQQPVHRQLLPGCPSKATGLWAPPTTPCLTQRPINGRLCLSVHRTAFDRSVLLPGLRVDCTQIKRAMSVLRKLTPSLLLVSAIQPPGEAEPDQRHLVLFDPDKWATRDTLLTDHDRGIVDKLGLAPTMQGELEMRCVALGYDNLPMDFIFRCVLPEGVIVSGYTLVGHIAHFNLKEEVRPYQYLIGEVVLDKIAKVRTVVNKTSNIDSTYRNFELELIAGESDYVTTVRENSYVYQLDFSKVYWNSRLSTEHERIVSRLTAADQVYDVFAGVGPFAIPAGKRGCRVLANDLNPASFDWLKINIPLNQSKRKGEAGKLNILPYNMDGRQFIKEVVIPDYLHQITNPPGTTSTSAIPPVATYRRFFVVMNLPALAVDFLDAFTTSGLTWQQPSLSPHMQAPPPLHFHCYLFLRKREESEASVQTRVCDRLNLPAAHPLRATANGNQGQPQPAGDSGFRLRLVRNVAPGKDMYCAEFVLSPATCISAATHQQPIVVATVANTTATGNLLLTNAHHHLHHPLVTPVATQGGMPLPIYSNTAVSSACSQAKKMKFESQ